MTIHDNTTPEELNILEHLHTKEVSELREDIRNYILNHAQLERKGLNLKISEMEKLTQQYKSLLLQQKNKLQEKKSFIASQNMLLQNKDNEFARLASEHRLLR
jgi:hypothetical protein